MFVIRTLLFLEHIQQSKRKTKQTNPAGSKDQSVKPTADSVSDLGVSALVSSESEESNSGNEEGDWLAPSPPSRPPNKVPRSDVVIFQFVFIITDMITDLSLLQVHCIGSASKSNGAVHRNGLILTPPGSRCNTPSSFRTPSSEVNAKLEVFNLLIH